jgi:hypothetical protein
MGHETHGLIAFTKNKRLSYQRKKAGKFISIYAYNQIRPNNFATTWTVATILMAKQATKIFFDWKNILFPSRTF